jgi:hypothetical protein
MNRREWLEFLDKFEMKDKNRQFELSEEVQLVVECSPRLEPCDEFKDADISIDSSDIYAKQTNEQGLKNHEAAVEFQGSNIH